jgi:hypothetical protein
MKTFSKIDTGDSLEYKRTEANNSNSNAEVNVQA